MVVKEWLAPSISAAALVVSCVTAYFSLFYVNERGSIILSSDTPSASFSNTNVTNVAYASNATIVNSGNRSMAILDIDLIVAGVKKIDRTRDDCDYAPADLWSGGTVSRPSKAFNPIVLEPNKISITRLHYNFEPLVFNDFQRNYSSEPTTDQREVVVAFCLFVRYVFPSGPPRSVSRPIWFVHTGFSKKDRNNISASLASGMLKFPLAVEE